MWAGESGCCTFTIAWPQLLKTKRKRSPIGFAAAPISKLLVALRKLVFENIPGDPTSSIFRKGGTLGLERKHWFRPKVRQWPLSAVLPLQSGGEGTRLRLGDDAATLLSYGSRGDAYAVFRAMLEDGNPPDSWKDLLEAASTDAVFRPLEAMANRSSKLLHDDR